MCVCMYVCGVCGVYVVWCMYVYVWYGVCVYVYVWYGVCVCVWVWCVYGMVYGGDVYVYMYVWCV